MTDSKKTPQQREATSPITDKSHTLAVATEVLSSRVGTLADAVQINNFKIDQLQKELNKKPDDAEVQFITGLAKAERKRHFRWAISTALLAAVGSAGVAYKVANEQGQERCQGNAKNIETLVSIIDTPELRGKYEMQIRDLRSDRNVCG